LGTKRSSMAGLGLVKDQGEVAAVAAVSVNLEQLVSFTPRFSTLFPWSLARDTVA
jgi:hypothetical protein